MSGKQAKLARKLETAHAAELAEEVARWGAMSPADCVAMVATRALPYNIAHGLEMSGQQREDVLQGIREAAIEGVDYTVQTVPAPSAN